MDGIDFRLHISGNATYIEFDHLDRSKELNQQVLGSFIEASKKGLTCRKISGTCGDGFSSDRYIIEPIDECSNNSILKENAKLKERVAQLESDMNKVGNIVAKWAITTLT